MSFKERNIIVSLVNFSGILLFCCFRVFQMVQSDTFTRENLSILFGIVIALAIGVTILGIILAQILTLTIRAYRTGDKNPDIDDLEDERDEIIDLRGTQVTYTFSSLGSFAAMLTFVFGQSPLVMFTLLIIVGVASQIAGDATRLLLYRRGF